MEFWTSNVFCEIIKRKPWEAGEEDRAADRTSRNELVRKRDVSSLITGVEGCACWAPSLVQSEATVVRTVRRWTEFGIDGLTHH